MITGANQDSGSVVFLEHKYPLWDRKFGDPQHLTSAPERHPAKKYDGRLLGNWLFPFAIPFPTHVDLSTRRAVYPSVGEVPVRFLPEPQDHLLTPFQPGGPSGRARNVPLLESGSLDLITPFDATSHFSPTEKGILRSLRNRTSARSLTTHSPISPQENAAPSTPSLEPYTVSPEGNPSPSGMSTAKGSLSRLPQQPTTSFPWPHTHRGATSMYNSDLPLPTTGHPLPQSFLERDVMANIHYELVLVVTHGRFATESRYVTNVTSVLRI